MKPIFILLLHVLAAVLISSATCSSHALSSYKRSLRRASLFSPKKLGSGCTTDFFRSFFSDKYTIEEHKVPTSDGYILTMFRVNLTQAEKAKLPKSMKKNFTRVLHFQHGLMDSSDGIFWNKPQENTIGFHLVNQGYDLWVNNNRGTKYSHTHQNKNISAKDFFNFSYDEMALFDVPAVLEFILKKTKVSKLTWIGHSQGTSQIFAAAMDPKTRDLVKSSVDKFIALAPIVYMNNTGSPALKIITKADSLLHKAADFMGLYEFFPNMCIKNGPAWGDLLFWGCKHGFEWLCNNSVPGFNTDSKWDTWYDLGSKYFLKHFMSGTSQKAFIKYGQAIASPERKFRKFDYGSADNLKKYGQKTAPEWGDLSKFPIQTVLVGASRDEFGSVEDVRNLMAAMNPKTTSYNILNGWDHFTFIMPRDPKPLFDILDSELKK